MGLQALKWKLEGTAVRLLDAFTFLPARLRRLGLHLIRLFDGSEKGKISPLPISRYSLWFMEFCFYLLDVLAVPEIYETLIEWGKWNTRPLSAAEITTAKTIYGDSIDYRRVRIDETARIVSKKTGILYVSFFTINCWGRFGDVLLIHELMHVWQFQNLGSIYIPRALLAQNTKEGYNYGGVAFLESVKSVGGALLDFNFEQQGDIVADGFSLRNGLCPRWTDEDRRQLPIFEEYLKELL